MSHIAQRLKYFDSSAFREVFNRQQAIANPVDLSVGLPEELSSDDIKQAGIDAIKNNKTTYTPANGIKELREAIAQKLSSENQMQCSADNVTVVPGLTTGQLLVYMAILDPGDEIIVMDPYYPPYTYLASSIGAHVVTVPTLINFQPDLPLIEASITQRTKAIVINSPSNPTGAVYPMTTLRKIAELAEKHNILVISDEIYEHFIYHGKHESIGSFYPNTLTMNGFSKEFAMTGWRLGYICGPQDIIEAINELQQYMVFSSSSIAQHAALAALQNRNKINGKYKKKRDLVHDSLKSMGYDVHGMDGAFYAYFKTPDDMADTEFVERAANSGLILVPGSAFSRLTGFVRLSYGADLETVKNGLEILRKVTGEIRK
jgi:aspartate aminotransferase